MDVLLLLACLVFGVSYICIALLKWNQMKYRGTGLPPGTMGWPIFGETSKFLGQGPEFMKKQRARYGSVFKSHVLGSPTVVSMDPDLNRYILMSESKGLVPGYPKATLDILGERNIAAVSGSTHKRIRGSLLLMIGSSALKEHILPKLDRDMRDFIKDWDGKIVDIQKQASDMAFLMHLQHIMEEESESIWKDFKAEFDKMVAGTLSLPINFPGTNYYRGFKARKNVIKTIRKIIENRRASSKVHDDMLNSLLENADKRYELDEKERDDQIIMILNSGYETVSRTTMLITKYLRDHPDALQEIRNEHFKIRQEKSNKDEPLDWNDCRKMKFTHAVIYETMRLATVVNGVLRKTTKDVELNGFIVPKGWRVYVYTREINYDTNLYPEPLKFNPWRWMENNGLETHNHFFLFGGGTRLCPGKELGLHTISVFLHYFLTNYRWEVLEGQKMSIFPRVEVPNGLHIRVSKY